MAKAVGINYQQLSSYDDDRLPVGANLAKLSVAGMSIDWLLTGEGSPDTPKSGLREGETIFDPQAEFEEAIRGEIKSVSILPPVDLSSLAARLVDVSNPEAVERFVREINETRSSLVALVAKLDRAMKGDGEKS